MGILFLTNAIDSSITTAKSGRIIHVGNSGTVGDGAAVGVGVGVGVEVIVWGFVVCIGVGVDVEMGVGVGVEEGVGVAAGLTVTETALETGEVTGVEALSVTVQVTECEDPVAVYE